MTILDGAGNVFTWDTRPELRLEFACRTAGRDMTAEEWDTYVGTGKQHQGVPAVTSSEPTPPEPRPAGGPRTGS